MRFLLVVLLICGVGCEESPRSSSADLGAGDLDTRRDGLSTNDGPRPLDLGPAPDMPRLSPCKRATGGTFAVPVTDSNARWMRRGVWAGTGVQGYLDGPRRGVRGRNAPGRYGFFETGSHYVLRVYDESTERYLTLAGSARGYLDGPFSRARFGGWSYGQVLSTTCAPDGSLYLLEPSLGVLRRLDFEKQVVETVLTDVGAQRAMTADPNGMIYIAGYDGLIIYDPQNDARRDIALPNNAVGHGYSVAYDPTRDRLYAANRCSGDWYVWYWELSNGNAFHGLIKFPQEGDVTRPQNTSGPFEGADLHCPSGIGFGPDDPTYRYLYYGGGDSTTFYRLDLEREYIELFAPPDPTAPRPYEELRMGDVDERLPFGSVVTWAGRPQWDAGDIYLSRSIYPDLIRFERVQ